MIISILFAAALLLTAFSSATETAFSSASRLKAYTRLRRNERHSRLTVKYLEKPSIFLITTLVGTNVGMVLSTSIVARQTSQFEYAWVEPVAVALLAFFILIFAELIPKHFMHLSADKNVDRLVLPLKFMRFILYPVIIVAELFTKLIAGRNNKAELLKSRTDIYGLISSIEGEFSELATRILDLDSTEVNAITHSLDSLPGVNMGISAEELLRKAKNYNSNYMLVFESDGQGLRGYITMSNILCAQGILDDGIVDGLPYFDRNVVLMNVVSELWKVDSPVGAVMGERGQPVGIVILDDIIDTLIGEPEIHKVSGNTLGLYWKDGNAAIR